MKRAPKVIKKMQNIWKHKNSHKSKKHMKAHSKAHVNRSKHPKKHSSICMHCESTTKKSNLTYSSKKNTFKHIKAIKSTCKQVQSQRNTSKDKKAQDIMKEKMIANSKACANS